MWYKLIAKKMSRVYNFCNNCGKTGHVFHQCKHPITSIGIIAYRKNAQTNNLEYLMIRRKDTLGFVDFMRGKYPLTSLRYLNNIINEMTVHEKNQLLTKSFSNLWDNLWGENIGIQYRGEERISFEKYKSLKTGIMFKNTRYTLASLIHKSSTTWLEPEWGYPKGRRNYQEKDLHCALREFEEETGYPKTSLNVIQNLQPFEEVFTGSNYKSYKHRYYVANMDSSAEPKQSHQISEVSKVEWKTCQQAIKSMRPYNIEKQLIMRNVDKLLKSNKLYQ